MAPNKNGKIITGDIKNELPFIALIFVDGNFANVEVFQNIL